MARMDHERGDAGRNDPADDADLLAALEASRRLLKRVRYDIHDGPLQEVAAFSHELHQLRQELAVADTQEARDRLAGSVDDLLGRLDELAEELRGIALAHKRGRELEGSLERTLRRTVEAYLETCEIDVAVTLDDERALTDSQRIAISRIVQTSLANVAQHSGASLARVKVADEPDGIAVEVWDDGGGFDVERSYRRSVDEGHLGLPGMLERVALLGGSLTIDSHPGGPTTVRALLPRVPAAPASVAVH